MTIIWSESITIAGQINFPDLWSAPAIGLWIEGATLPSWRKVGYLKIEPLIDGEYFSSKIKAIDYGKNLIEIPFNSYKLSFEPLASLLAIYSNLSIKIAPIGTQQMAISYQDKNRETGDVAEALFTPLLASAEALPVNLNRHDGTIYNRTNRIIYVKWGTVAATTASLAVPVGANIKIPLDYTGAVQIIRASGNLSGDVLIQTVSYL